MTPVEEMRVMALVDHYNENVMGRRLSEFYTEPLTQELVAGMIKTMVVREGKEALAPVVVPFMLQCVGIGIWLAEIGKTKMLKEKGELQ